MRYYFLTYIYFRKKKKNNVKTYVWDQTDVRLDQDIFKYNGNKTKISKKPKKKGRQPRGSAALGYKLVSYQKEEVITNLFFVTNSL